MQSDIKRTLEERETKMREMTVMHLLDQDDDDVRHVFSYWHVKHMSQVHKLEEIDSKLVASEKSRVQVFTIVINFVIITQNHYLGHHN